MLQMRPSSCCSASYWKSKTRSSWAGSMTPTPPIDTSQSFEKSAIPLLLDLKPSRLQQTVSLSCHVLAIIAVFLSNIPLTIQLAITLAIVVSLFYNLHQDKQEQLLIWRAGNRWVIEKEPPSPAITNTGTSAGTFAKPPALNQHETSQTQPTQAQPPQSTPSKQNTVSDSFSTDTLSTSQDSAKYLTTRSNSKTSVAAELQSIDFFSRWLVILTLHTETGRNEKFVIPFDALSENTFRLLRVRLRIEGFTLLNPKEPD